MTTTAINNIHNLKYFDKINTLLQIENLEVFADEINFLYERLDQYAEEIDTSVKNCELMKASIAGFKDIQELLKGENYE